MLALKKRVPIDATLYDEPDEHNVLIRRYEELKEERQMSVDQRMTLKRYDGRMNDEKLRGGGTEIE